MCLKEEHAKRTSKLQRTCMMELWEIFETRFGETCKFSNIVFAGVSLWLLSISIIYEFTTDAQEEVLWDMLLMDNIMLADASETRINIHLSFYGGEFWKTMVLKCR